MQRRTCFSILSIVAAVGLAVLAAWSIRLVLDVGALRGALSAELGAHWDSLALLAVVSLFFATSTLGLLVYLRTRVIPRAESDLLALERRLQASDQLASIGRLASGVAHEINNPMTYVTTNLQLLGEELQDADTVRTRDLAPLVDAALGGAMRVGAIVRAMDAFQSTRDAEGDADVDAAIDAALARCPRLADVAEVRRTGSRALRVRGEPAWIVEVLTRILDNARRALQAVDGGVLRIDTRVCDDGSVELTISDDGPGIPDAVRRSACDPFVTTREVGEGAGLGLFVCQGIVGSLGGRIDLESEPGQGTTVRVRLPQSHAA